MTDRWLIWLHGRSEEGCRDGLADRRASAVQVFSTRNVCLRRDMYLPSDRSPISGALCGMIGNRALFAP